MTQEQTDKALSLFKNLTPFFDVYDMSQLIGRVESATQKVIVTAQLNRQSPRTQADILEYELANIWSEEILSRFAITDNNLYYLGDEWHLVFSNFLTAQFTEMLRMCVFPSVIGVMTLSRLMNFIDSRIKTLELQTNEQSKRVIQFKGSYLKDGILHEGLFKETIPMHIIKRSVDPTLERAPKPTWELVLNICNNDPKVADALLDMLSLSFINSQKMRISYPVIPILYGPRGKNGKTTLLNLMQMMLGGNCAKGFRLNNMQGFELYQVVTSMFAFDDETTNFVNIENSSVLKAIATGDSLQVRNIYSEARSINPTTFIMLATNNLIKIEDKSGGMARRLKWIESGIELQKPDEFFEELQSEKNLQETLNHLVWRSQRIMSGTYDYRTKIEEATAKATSKFLDNNNNVHAFVESIHRENVVNHSLKEIREKYEQWCEANDENPLGKTNFEAVLESDLQIRKKRIPLKSILGADLMLYQELDENTRVRAWVDKD